MAIEENSSSSSCNAANKKLMAMQDEDRISCLHESLVYHILSFLDMKSVVETSLLSKRWRNVWRSVSILNFDEAYWKRGSNFKLQKGKFKFFVDTVLLLRDGSDIHKFKLFFTAAHSGDSVRIERWIAYAIKRSVQVLDIAGVSIASPDSICLSGRVNTLDLGAIVLPGDENGNLILDLPILENLIIQSCDHCELISLTISGPKLKYLQLCNTFPEFNCGTSIKISAPNLTSLKCKGYTYQDYTLENLSALVTAEIDTKINCKDEDADEVTTLNTLFGRCLSSILKGLTNAKSLTLSGHGFQVFEELPKLLEGVPNSYQNLKYLKLIEWCDKSHIYSLAKLLEIFPHLETLVMERRKRLIEFELEEGDWDGELSFTCMFCHLKSIEMHNFEGSENEFKFLAFLLKGALVMEKVSITSTIKLSDKEKDLAEVKKKIQSLEETFSRVTILLNLKRVF